MKGDRAAAADRVRSGWEMPWLLLLLLALAALAPCMPARQPALPPAEVEDEEAEGVAEDEKALCSCLTPLTICLTRAAMRAR